MSESIGNMGRPSESTGEAANMSASIFAHMISATSRTAKIQAWPNLWANRPHARGKDCDGFGPRLQMRKAATPAPLRGNPGSHRDSACKPG